MTLNTLIFYSNLSLKKKKKKSTKIHNTLCCVQLLSKFMFTKTFATLWEKQNKTKPFNGCKDL